MIDLTNPVLLGPVQNQEHYMQGVVARRNNFVEPILRFLEEAHDDFAKLTGRHYGLLTQYKTDDADTVFVSVGLVEIGDDWQSYEASLSGNHRRAVKKTVPATP